MKIAVIGSGISGLAAAHLLSEKNQVWVFEAENRIGGHTHTVGVNDSSGQYMVDTGFIVFNLKTYPNFVRLMQQLQIKWQNSDMSFGVATKSLEYSPSTLSGLYGSFINATSPAMWRLPFEIVRFRRLSSKLLSETANESESLDDFLKRNCFSRFFKQMFILPMGAAIWSAVPNSFGKIPAVFFARFFENHAFLKIDQPRWLTLKGGSCSYLEPLSCRFRQRILLNSPVRSIKRFKDRVQLRTDKDQEDFDQVVFACHSDEALEIIKDPSNEEIEILSAIPYQKNHVVLHTDAGLMPKRKSAWASWNYRVPEQSEQPIILTYDMNRLQTIESPQRFLVTLNADERINQEKICRKFVYSHPVFTSAGVAAQKRWDEINGKNRTWFVGAYWRYGFHEDGMLSAIRVARAMGIKWA